MPTSLRPRYLVEILATLLATTTLAACGAIDPQSEPKAETRTVPITDHHGQIQIPVNPQRVVALDNIVFQTLNDWGIPLVAAPKGVIGDLWPVYSADTKVLDVGSHREPNLEAVNESAPDLIIGGYRFADYYSDLKKIQPATIEINPQADPELDQIAGMKTQVTILGQIFNKQYENGIETAAPSCFIR